MRLKTVCIESIREMCYTFAYRNSIGPVPKIQEDGDIIVKVEYTALCGRYVQEIWDLYTYLTIFK